MAKNLQSVLNSVVNDLLQEDGMRINPGSFEGLGGNSGKYLGGDFESNVTGGMDHVMWDQAKKEAAVAKEMEQKAALDDLTPKPGMDPNFLASRYLSQQSDPTLASIDAGGESPIDNPYKQAMYKARHGWDDLKKWASENPGLAALGAGLGGSALAAGAGALYLRKKQREANRRAGR